MIKKRDILLDVMKGVGILLVVFGHTHKGVIGDAMGLFRMPLFLMLSGAALVYAGRFSLKKKFRGLIVPYLTFSILSFVYWAFVEARFRPIHDEPMFAGWLGTLDIKVQQFVNIFAAMGVGNAFNYNVVLWFLPCLFVASLIYEGAQRMGGGSDARKWMWKVVVSVVCIAVYAIIDPYAVRLPWCGELALLSVPFLLIGEAGYPRLRSLMEKSKVLTILNGGGSLVLFLLLYVWLEPKTNMNGHQLPALWLFYLMAVLGSVVVMAVCRLIEYNERGWMQYCGKNSLIIMCVHEPIKRILIQVMSMATGVETTAIRQSIWVSVLIVVVIALICLPIIHIVNRYIPFLIGKTK